MKLKINHLLIAFIGLLLFSCSSDDSVQTDSGETTPLAIEKVFENVIVEGATKETGAPNAPNEAISFTLSTENTRAVLVDGFNIEFNSNDNITGAYLQFKGNEGTVADGYYDIDISQLNTKVNSTKKSMAKTRMPKFKKEISKKSSIEGDIVVDVDFTTTIEPGTFCYIICVYDANGNISAPQEVCVTVESWGGNDDLEGIWNYTKTEEFYDGVTETMNVGDKDCYDGTINCSNQEQLSYTSCYSTDSFKFTINSNGTYEYEIYSTNDLIDYTASSEACQIIKANEDEYYLSKGNWAYDQVKGEIVLVGLEYIENYEGVTESGTYDVGDADVYELKADVNGTSLILTEEYFDTSGAIEEYYKYYFDKQ